MVEIPEPYVRMYPLISVKRDNLLELYNLFRSAPLQGLIIVINLTARGSTYVMDDSVEGMNIEQELMDIIHNKEKVITGFFIEARQKIASPPPQVSVSLKLNRDEARLTITRPREISESDLFALNGLEESANKILTRWPRTSDAVLDSPYTLMIAATVAGALAYLMPPTAVDPVKRSLIAVGIIVVLWMANRFRAYKTSHVVFDMEGEENVLRTVNHTLKRYSREIIGGAITLSISLIVLFITWFFHLAS